MRFEERLALRVALRAALVLLIALFALAGGTYQRSGATPLWFALVVGIPIALLLSARLIVRRPGVSGSARSVGRRIGGLLEAAVANLRRIGRRRRVRRVELAALEAAQNEKRLSPDNVLTSAEALFRLVQLGWSARDPGRLETLLAPNLLEEWKRELAAVTRSGRHESVEVVGDVRLEYVGFTTPDIHHGARAVVLIEATLRRFVGKPRQTEDAIRTLCQYWTLGLRDGRWTVLAIVLRRHLAQYPGRGSESGTPLAVRLAFGRPDPWRTDTMSGNLRPAGEEDV